jgi:glycosyltransferase 2 family protein
VRRALALLALALGVALLVLVLYRADLPATGMHLARLGAWGLLAILVLAATSVTCEATSWLLTLTVVPPTPAWWTRLTRVLLVGAVLEVLTPLAWLGGDSAKALLLRHRHGVSLRDATTSLVLSRTTDLASLVLFIATGLILMIRADILPRTFHGAAATALAVLTGVAALFVLAQFHRPIGRVLPWLSARWARRRQVPAPLARALDAARGVEERLAAFYAAYPARLPLSILASLGEWVSGAALTYVALRLFGTPVTPTEAVVIESVVLLVRATLFFVPGDVGTQDAALVATSAAITGSAAAGLALAAVHRARDLLVLGAGVLLAVSFWRQGGHAGAPPWSGAGREAR